MRRKSSRISNKENRSSRLSLKQQNWQIPYNFDNFVEPLKEEAVVAITAAMVVVILDLIAHILINLLEQKVGKIEVMEILLKTLNMKMVGAGEKGECPKKAMIQMRQVSNPFL